MIDRVPMTLLSRPSTRKSSSTSCSTQWIETLNFTSRNNFILPPLPASSLAYDDLTTNWVICRRMRCDVKSFAEAAEKKSWMSAPTCDLVAEVEGWRTENERNLWKSIFLERRNQISRVRNDFILVIRFFIYIYLLCFTVKYVSTSMAAC